MASLLALLTLLTLTLPGVHLCKCNSPWWVGGHNPACPPQAWPGLRTTFRWAPPAPLAPGGLAFQQQPRTQAEAERQGWRSLAGFVNERVPWFNPRCPEGEKFYGQRFGHPKDPTIAVIYDSAGYIVGLQSVLLVKDVDLALNPIDSHDTYVKDMFFEEPAWFTTMYLVDPNTICSRDRSRAEWNREGTGNQLTLLSIDKGGLMKFIELPLTKAEAIGDPGWFEHACFPGMGRHFFQFDHSPEQPCNTSQPLQLLYAEGGLGELLGFVWMHLTRLPQARWEKPDSRALASFVR